MQRDEHKSMRWHTCTVQHRTHRFLLVHVGLVFALFATVHCRRPRLSNLGVGFAAFFRGVDDGVLFFALRHGRVFSDSASLQEQECT